MTERPPPPPPQPRYLPPEALRAAYEKLAAAGSPGAKLRLEMLRRSTTATAETEP